MGLRDTHLELINFGAIRSGLAVKEGDVYKYKSFKLADLGSQNIKGPLKERVGFSVAKDYFKSLGIEHTSFDITGKYGAVQVDLGKELKEYWGEFDFVANFATSEHVKGEYNCFKNIHNFCKQNGPMVHSVPRVNSWPNHCYHYYDERFFSELAAANGYELLLLREMKKDYNIGAYVPVHYPGEKHDQTNMQALMIKTKDNDFISEVEFRSLRQ